MLTSAELSLEQAPPISIPLRFFLTAPLFGLTAALVALLFGPELIASRWSPSVLAFSHLLTLGFLTMVMCGAMLQMLPVVAASPVPQVVAAGTTVHLSLILGTGSLVTAFFSLQASWMKLSLIFLGSGIFVFLLAVGVALWRVRHPNPTVTGMRLALISLTVTMVFGLILGSGLLGIGGWVRMPNLVDGHLGWGLVGWVGLLLLAVSYQVVPMFQVTPEYPVWMRKGLIWWLWVGLFIWSLLLLGANAGYWSRLVPTFGLIPVVAGFLLFAAVTLGLQQRRRRRLSDVTLMFWRLAMISLLGCLLLWLVGQFFPSIFGSVRYSFLFGLLSLLGVGGAVVNGMLYKIVPFLCWFHLQNRQLALQCLSVPIPNMKEFISDRRAKGQFVLYLLALLLAACAIFLPQWFVRPFALLFAFSNFLLWFNLFRAILRYRDTNRSLIASQGP